MVVFFDNESKHMDLMEWLVTLEDLGVNIAKAFPKTVEMNGRVDRLLTIRSETIKAMPDITVTARRLGINDDLDDEAAIVSTADHAAFAQDPSHRERVAEFFERAADAARGDAIRQFRRSDVLEQLRPAFDELAQRITNAAKTIPTGVMNLDDAARTGHSDAYQQLERDIDRWSELAQLIGTLSTAGVIAGEGNRYPAEFMVDDLSAYTEAKAYSSRPLRHAQGIAAGRPNLHVPTGKAQEPIHDDRARALAYEANTADRAAREDLGLVSR